MPGAYIRRCLSALVMALVVAGGVPVAASASGGVRLVSVAAETRSQGWTHPCADGSGRVCQAQSTFTTTAHTDIRAGAALATAVGAGLASACAASYAWPVYQVDDHNYYGQVVTTVVLSGEDYWDGCSSGWVWVSLSCSAQPGYSCGAASHGSFWDSGVSASTAWGNQQTSNFCCPVTWYLRIDIYPSGELVSRYSN